MTSGQKIRGDQEQEFMDLARMRWEVSSTWQSLTAWGVTFYIRRIPRGFQGFKELKQLPSSCSDKKTIFRSVQDFLELLDIIEKNYGVISAK